LIAIRGNEQLSSSSFLFIKKRVEKQGKEAVSSTFYCVIAPIAGSGALLFRVLSAAAVYRSAGRAVSTATT
jgi:hypothetical protein